MAWPVPNLVFDELLDQVSEALKVQHHRELKENARLSEELRALRSRFRSGLTLSSSDGGLIDFQLPWWEVQQKLLDQELPFAPPRHLEECVLHAAADDEDEESCDERHAPSTHCVLPRASVTEDDEQLSLEEHVLPLDGQRSSTRSLPDHSRQQDRGQSTSSSELCSSDGATLPGQATRRPSLFALNQLQSDLSDKRRLSLTSAPMNALQLSGSSSVTTLPDNFMTSPSSSASMPNGRRPSIMEASLSGDTFNVARRPSLAMSSGQGGKIRSSLKPMTLPGGINPVGPLQMAPLGVPNRRAHKAHSSNGSWERQRHSLSANLGAGLPNLTEGSADGGVRGGSLEHQLGRGDHVRMSFDASFASHLRPELMGIGLGIPMPAPVEETEVPGAVAGGRRVTWLGEDSAGIPVTALEPPDTVQEAEVEEDEDETIEMLPVWKIRRKSTSTSMLGTNSRKPSEGRNSLQKVHMMGSKTLKDLDEGQHDHVGKCCSRLVAKPSSGKRLAWDVFGISLIAWDLIWIPMQAFAPPKSTGTTFIAGMATVFWTLDIPASFLVGYHNEGVLEMRVARIARHYFKTWLPFDIVVIVIDWTLTIMDQITEDKTGAAGAGAGYMRLGKVVRFFRLLRLLRLLKAHGVVSELLERIQSEQHLIIVGIIKLLLFIMMTNHLVACAWYLLGSLLGDNTSMPTWVKAFNMEDRALLYRYTTSLHWSLTQLTPASMEIYPQNEVERFFTVGIIFGGMVAFSSFVSSITNAMTQWRNLNSERNEQYSNLRRYFSENKCSVALMGRIYGCLQQSMNRSKSRVHEAEVTILQLLPWNLKAELQEEVYAPILIVHPFFLTFSGLFPSNMRKIFQNAVAEISKPIGQEVFGSGEVASQMYFCLSGILSYTKETKLQGEPPTFVASNQFCSEPALWIKWKHCGQLLATSHCELVALKAAKVGEVLAQEEGQVKRYVKIFVRYFKKYPDQLHDAWGDIELLQDMVHKAFLGGEDDEDEDERRRSLRSTATNQTMGSMFGGLAARRHSLFGVAGVGRGQMPRQNSDLDSESESDSDSDTASETSQRSTGSRKSAVSKTSCTSILKKTQNDGETIIEENEEESEAENGQVDRSGTMRSWVVSTMAEERASMIKHAGLVDAASPMANCGKRQTAEDAAINGASSHILRTNSGKLQSNDGSASDGSSKHVIPAPAAGRLASSGKENSTQDTVIAVPGPRANGDKSQCTEDPTTLVSKARRHEAEEAAAHVASLARCSGEHAAARGKGNKEDATQPPQKEAATHSQSVVGNKESNQECHNEKSARQASTEKREAKVTVETHGSDEDVRCGRKSLVSTTSGKDSLDDKKIDRWLMSVNARRTQSLEMKKEAELEEVQRAAKCKTNRFFSAVPNIASNLMSKVSPRSRDSTVSVQNRGSVGSASSTESAEGKTTHKTGNMLSSFFRDTSTGSASKKVSSGQISQESEHNVAWR